MRIKATPSPTFDEQMAQIGNSRWSVARLAKLSSGLQAFKLPISHMCVGDVIEGGTLRQMAGHVNAVIAADMTKPIILSEDGEIMDGRHRVIRAIVEGRKTIKAVRFLVNPDPCEVIEGE